MKDQRVALVGFGAIGRSVARFLVEQPQGLRLVAVLVRDLQRSTAEDSEEFGQVFTDRWEDLAHQSPDVLVEAAGAGAVRSYGELALSSGMDLLVATVGVLGDDEYLSRLKQTASEYGQRILLPSGAIGGLDALDAASLMGLASVIHTIRKPPQTLLSPERADEVMTEGEQVQIFEGSARESALAFPDNTNSTVAVSLAGIGVDKTVVRIVADPGASRNMHEIAARGEFGELTFKIENKPSPSNPKTSEITALSIMSLLLGRVLTLKVGG